MRVSVVVLLVALVGDALAESWSWPDGQQRRAGSSSSSSSSSSRVPSTAARDTPSVSARRFVDTPGRQRYDVIDPDSDDFTLPHPEDIGGLGPNRPLGRPPPPFSPNRPFPPENNYPLLNPNPGYRPPRPLPPPSNGPIGPIGPIGGVSPNRPPPGVDHSDPTDVSECKCVHAFNCEGRALQFGSCDVGKRYCCTKEPRGLGSGGPRPGGYGASPGEPLGGPGYYGKPAILTGPGGPSGGFGPVKVDRYDRYPGTSSPYDRYPGSGGGGFPGSTPGVLVGPRPTYYRPNPADGFATRPGDFYNNNNNNYNGVRGPNGSPNGSPYRDYDSYNGRAGYGLNRA